MFLVAQWKVAHSEIERDLPDAGGKLGDNIPDSYGDRLRLMLQYMQSWSAIAAGFERAQRRDWIEISSLVARLST